jgi:hypothetical protein
VQAAAVQEYVIVGCTASVLGAGSRGAAAISGPDDIASSSALVRMQFLWLAYNVECVASVACSCTPAFCGFSLNTLPLLLQDKPVLL